MNGLTGDVELVGGENITVDVDSVSNTITLTDSRIEGGEGIEVTTAKGKVAMPVGRRDKGLPKAGILAVGRDSLENF